MTKRRLLGNRGINKPKDVVPLCEDHGDVVASKVPKSACEICALREMERDHYAEIAKFKEAEALLEYDRNSALVEIIQHLLSIHGDGRHNPNTSACQLCTAARIVEASNQVS
jgi:hypothetical protein